MPKRSERDRFDAASFARNPFEGASPEDVFKTIRWGSSPSDIWTFKAPESMAAMGLLAAVHLRLPSGKRQRPHWGVHESPFLGVGVLTNMLYIVPRLGNGRPVSVSKGPYRPVGFVTRTDYYSDKGGEDAYYYHDHEKPFPVLYQHPPSGVCVIMPAKMHGKRSYAVVEEGIVG